MKRFFTAIVFLSSVATVLLLCNSFITKKHLKARKAGEGTGFAVVELFTSEGCSSCPPADKAVADLVSKGIKNVFVLSYHVDYWNRLGWKDEFSQRAFSIRQQQYARHLKLDQVYTPQIVVNGSVEFVGSNNDALNKVLFNQLESSHTSNLSITAAKQNNSVVVNYRLLSTEPMLLNTAIVLPAAITWVKKGENGGKVLKHVNIVSVLETAEAKPKGEVVINVPEGLVGKSFKVIAYTQSKKSLKVFGADEVEL